MQSQISLSEIESLITTKCTKPFGEVYTITPFESHASQKKYFKVTTPSGVVVVSYLNDATENAQFVRIAEHLTQSGLRAPAIYYSDELVIIQEYLGAQNLVEWFDSETTHWSREQSDTLLFETMMSMVRLAADMHAKTDHESLQLPSFLNEYALRDINLFVKHWEAGELVGELNNILSDLHNISPEWIAFSHRDYQLRNIMALNSNPSDPVLIDFQSALSGPVTYDLASLIFSSRYSFTESEINQLVAEYSKYSQETHGREYDVEVLERFLYLTALIRVIQAISAYRRSMKITGKNFESQIARGLKNLKLVVKTLEERYGYALPGFNDFIAHHTARVGLSKLPIVIRSFSCEREGLPKLSKRHINILLDLRTFSNPGRIDTYKSLTGKDSETIEYLEQFPEIHQLKNSLKGVLSAYFTGTYEFSAQIDQVSIYLGCNGGRHRSVYFAEVAYKYLINRLPTSKISVSHQWIER